MSEDQQQNQENPELSPEALAFVQRTFDMARSGNEAELIPLLQQGLPVNLTNENGDSFLILAAYNDHNSLAQTLLNNQADINWANQRGQTALTCAVFKQNTELVKMFLKAGADPHAGAQSAVQVAELFGTEEIKALVNQEQ